MQFSNNPVSRVRTEEGTITKHQFFSCPFGWAGQIYCALQPAVVLAVLVSLALLATSSNALAQSILINDCLGFTRATRQVAPGESSKVQVEVSTQSGTASNGSELKLTNAVSGENYSAQSANGMATFERVPSGVYTLSASDSTLKVGGVWLGATAPSVALATGAALLTGGAAAGGVAGIAVAVDNATGGSPGGVPTPAPTASPTATPCPVCNPDIEPTPIDDFFGDKSAQQPGRSARTQELSPYR